jgi:diguanylate cyclase (GGDEF)-like protein/PAS domain S-box-containing protein
LYSDFFSASRQTMASPKKLKTIIIIGSATGLFVMTSIIALVSLMPLYSKIKQQEEEKLIRQTEEITLELINLTQQVETFSVDFFDHFQNQAPITPSNPDLERLYSLLRPALNESIVGVSYRDMEGQQKIAVGQPLPVSLEKTLPNQPQTLLNTHSVSINNEAHWIITYHSSNPQRLGQLSFILRVTNLLDLKNKCHTFIDPCHYVLFGQKKPTHTIIFPIHDYPKKPTSKLLNDPAIDMALDNIVSHRSGTIWCRQCNYYLTYRPMVPLNGGLLIATHRIELYASIYQQLLTIAGAICILIILGTSGAILILRPLTGQMQAEILERQKAEIALRKERDFTKTLFDYNPAFLIVLDLQGKVKLMNDAMLKTLGYDLEEVVGKNYLNQFISRQLGETIPWVYELMIHHQSSIRAEERLRTKDNREIIVDWHGQAIFNSDNQETEYFLGAGLDITERKRSQEELQLLQRITKAVSVASDFDSALEIALHLVCETTGWEFGEAWIPNPEQTYLEYSIVGYGRQPNHDTFRRKSQSLLLKPNEGLAGRVWQTQKPEWIPNISEEDHIKHPRYELVHQCYLKALFGVPILAENRVLSILVFLISTPQDPDTRFVELISSIAMQLGSVFQRKQAEAQYRSIFENAVEGLFQMSFSGEYIKANPALAQILGYGSPEELIAQKVNIDSQYVEGKFCNEFIRLLQQEGSVSNFEVQLYRADQNMIWVLQNARAIWDTRKNRILYYEGSMFEITSLKQTEEKLRYGASHDGLTHLWNRAFFIEKLRQSIIRCHEQPDYQFFVLFLDLDGFKFVNDSLGHSVGDQLLIKISERLRGCLRSKDILARLGGDEFTILLEDVSNLDEAQEVAKRVQAALKKPLKLGENQVFTGSSIGIVQSNREYHFPPEILRDADTAMYRAKQQGKGCSVVFDATMRTDAIRRLHLQTDLRRALDRGEFHLNYQPIIELNTHQISGFEALLRWSHPQEGNISPAEFIPVAEEAGLIVSIGEWVLREACRQLYQWKQQFPQHSQLMMSVNLSSQQFTANLSQQIDEILSETAVVGSDLKLEITETAIMSDPNLAIRTLNELKQRDIVICIDDFGTGYCSLGYLHQFPVDILKIDRSFVSRMSVAEDKREIVKIIVALANSLGMDAIAEGIETLDQLTQLQRLQCKYGQGYFFAKPLSSAEAGQLLTQPHLEVS